MLRAGAANRVRTIIEMQFNSKVFEFDRERGQITKSLARCEESAPNELQREIENEKK